jgi:hypothetical protein
MARHVGRICGPLVDALTLIRAECFPQQAMAVDVQNESIAVSGGQRQTVAVVVRNWHGLFVGWNGDGAGNERGSAQEDFRQHGGAEGDHACGSAPRIR